MSKTFRPWKIDQPLLLPPSVQDFVGEDHLARFVLALVLEHLDLSGIEAAYAGERGQPPFDPAMMTALLLYAYCNGVYSSRRRGDCRLHRLGLPYFPVAASLLLGHFLSFWRRSAPPW
jgi:transposase